MELIGVEVESFKRIKYMKVDIPRGTKVILIEGDNSSGKSALFDAIGLLLTNEAQEKMSTYIRWGSKKFKILLRFIHNERIAEYSLKVYASSTPTERILTIEGDPAPYTGGEATARMAEILDPVLTQYSSFIRQHNSVAILAGDPGKRLVKLKAIFEADIVDIAASLGKDREAGMKLEVAADTAALETLQKSLLQLTSMDEIELPDVTTAKQQLEQYSLLQDAHNIKLQNFNAYAKQKQEWDKAQVELENLSALIETREAELEKLKSQLTVVPQFDQEHYSQLLVHLETYRKKKTAIEGNITRAKNLQTYLEQARRELEDMNAVIGAYGDEAGKAEQYQTALTTLQNEMQELEISVRSLTKELDLAVAGKCSQCGQDWHGLDTGTLSSQLAQAKANLTLKKPQLDHLITSLKAAQSASSRITSAHNQVVTIQQKQATLEADIAQVNLSDLENQRAANDADTAVLETEVSQQQTNLSKYQTAKDSNAATEQQIQTLTTQVASAEAKIEVYEAIAEPKATPNPGEFPYELQLAEAQKSINIYETKVQELARIREHNEKIERSRQKIEKDSTVLKERLEQSDRNIATVRNARLYLANKFGSHLVQEGSAYVQRNMNKFFQRAFKHLHVYLDQVKQNVTFMYCGEEGVKTPVSLAGGYERELLSVAFCRSLCNMQNLGLMMLDEADSAANETRSMQLYRLLLQDKGIDQLVCVTHKEPTKEMLKNEAGAYVISMEQYV